MKRLMILALMMGVSVLATGCNTARPIKTGFLGGYQGFKKVSDIDFDEFYIHPGVDWRKYDKVRIIRIRSYVHPDPEAKYRAFTSGDVARIKQLFEQAMMRDFGLAYKVVTYAGPDVLDVRVALTAMEPTNVDAGAATWVIPGAKEIDEGYEMMEDKSMTYGRVGMEVGFFDSETGRLLFGYITLKIGGKMDKGQFSKWGVVEDACKKWAQKMVQQLRKFQEGETKKARL